MVTGCINLIIHAHVLRAYVHNAVDYAVMCWN